MIRFVLRSLRNLSCVLVCVLGSSGCAHRTLRVQDAEVERASRELTARGEAEVKTQEGITTKLHGDETVTTVSGDFRVDRWVASNCEPSGVCHFGTEGITVERVDPGASARTAFEVVGASLVAGAASVGVTCATGFVCDSDSARTSGAIVLGSVAGLLVVGVVALASCKSCWAWK